MKTPLDKLAIHRIGKKEYAPLWALLDAAFKHDADKLAKICKDGVDINMQESRGWTALQYAVDYNDSLAVKLLLNQGSNMYACCQTNSNPFHHAIIHGKREVLQCFMDNNAELFIDPLADEDETSVLMWHSMLSGKINAAIGYLRDGVTPVASDLHNDTMLTHAASLGYSTVVKELIDYGLDVCHTSRLLYNIFDVAAMNNHVDCMTLLYEAGVDINHVGKTGMTALMYAVHKNSIDAVKWLLAHNADTKIVSNNGWNAYDWSIAGTMYQYGGVDTNKFFSDRGISPLRYDFSGRAQKRNAEFEK